MARKWHHKISVPCVCKCVYSLVIHYMICVRFKLCLQLCNLDWCFSVRFCYCSTITILFSYVCNWWGGGREGAITETMIICLLFLGIMRIWPQHISYLMFCLSKQEGKTTKWWIHPWHGTAVIPSQAPSIAPRRLTCWFGLGSYTFHC